MRPAQGGPQGGIFFVHQGISHGKEVEYTKDKHVHPTPVVSDFALYFEYEKQKQQAAGVVSPYVFVYTGEKLTCNDCGADLYRATYNANAEKYCYPCKEWKRRHGHSSVRPDGVVFQEMPVRHGRRYSLNDH